MRDFYEDLGISRAAQAAEIKAAYKKLAKLYHPDRNPGNKAAEENFKKVNEAYHTLIDPVKKWQYDLQRSGALTHWQEDHTWTEPKQRRYYRWRPAQQPAYKFDKNYFKIQGLAFLVFLIFAGFCFGVIHTAHYYVRQQQMEKMRANNQKLRQVNGLFTQGRYVDAFTLIGNLQEEEPLEYRFGFARDSLVDALRQQADLEFKSQDFTSAIEHYNILKNYERPVRVETLENLSMCQYYLGNFEESMQALKHLHNQDPNNLGLIYQIAVINLEKLDNPKEALQYFTLGKKLFKNNLSHVYGNAFQIVMNPEDAPDIYYYIFVGRAKANMQLKHWGDAITDCNWAIFLRRDQPEPHYFRAIASIRNHQFQNVCDDLTISSQLGIQNSNELRKKYCLTADQ